jgi:hypothetical protein
VRCCFEVWKWKLIKNPNDISNLWLIWGQTIILFINWCIKFSHDFLCSLSRLKVVGIGFHSCNSITPGIVGKHLAIEVGSISCSAILNYHCSLNWEAYWSIEFPSKNMTRLFFKKLPCLKVKNLHLCKPHWIQHLFLSRCFKGSSDGNTNTNTHIGHNFHNFSNWTIWLKIADMKATT